MPSIYHSEEKETLIRNAGFRQHFKAKQWAEFNRKFFNELAPKYDYLNEVMTFGLQRQYKNRAVKKVRVQPGDAILDIATGSGDMAILAAKGNPHVEIIGVDVAENMLDIAKKRSEKYANVSFQYADALYLPFEDNTFQVTLTSYGLRNYDDIKQGICEMIRVTKPGGQIITIDLGKPEGWFNKGVYRIYFEKIMPFLGKHVFHRGEFNSFQYLPESNKYFPDPAELKDILYECGLKNIQTFSYMNGIVSQQVGYV